MHTQLEHMLPLAILSLYRDISIHEKHQTTHSYVETWTSTAPFVPLAASLRWFLSSRWR